MPRTKNGVTAAKLTTTRINSVKGNLDDVGLICGEDMRWHEHTASQRDHYNPVKTDNPVESSRTELTYLKPTIENTLLQSFHHEVGQSPLGRWGLALETGCGSLVLVGKTACVETGLALSVTKLLPPYAVAVAARLRTLPDLDFRGCAKARAEDHQTRSRLYLAHHH